jgi:hypothetical protein
MSNINVNRITLADASSTGSPVPNIVPRNAEKLTLTLHVDELPANTRRLRVVVNIFQPDGRANLGGWFNSRVLDVGPVDVTFDVSGTGPQVFRVEITHPDHEKRLRRPGYSQPAVSFFFLTRFIGGLIRLFFSYRWHEGPGPYDTEVALTASNESGSSASTTRATYQYPFISI